VYLFSPLTPLILLMTLMAGTSPGQQATFPEVKAQNLEGKMMTLPNDFSGDLNLVLIAYDLDQLKEMDTWLEAEPELFKGYPGIPCYEVPTLGKEYRLARFLINRGMRSEVSKEERRAHTITLYVDKTPFEHALQIPNENRITVLLVDKKGKVLWQEQGVYYEIKGNALRTTLAKLKENR
jgi:hypothetical protein